MSGEFSALQEEEGEEEQEFADDPILQLDMKVRPLCVCTWVYACVESRSGWCVLVGGVCWS